MLYVLSIVAISLMSRHFGYCQINRKLVVLETAIYSVIIMGVYWTLHHGKALMPEELCFPLGMVLFGGILAFTVSLFQKKNKYVFKKVQAIAEKKKANIVVREAMTPSSSPYPKIPKDSFLLCYNQTGFALIGSLNADQLSTFDAILREISGLSLQYDAVLENESLNFYPISGMNYLDIGNCKFGAIDGSRMICINRQDKEVNVEVFPGWHVLR